MVKAVVAGAAGELMIRPVMSHAGIFCMVALPALFDYAVQSTTTC